MKQIDFTIIVPTLNRPEQLAGCLRALAGLNYPREGFELIVVDDGSRMPLEPVISQVSKQLTVTLRRQANAGPAAARNNGAAKARGRFLAFTDDDCEPASGWLSVLAARLDAEPDRMVGGRIVNSLPGNPFSSASQLIVDLVYAHYNVDAGRARFLASNNMAMGTDLFHSIGGFSPSFRTSEDRDLCDRWVHAGYRLVYEPHALVYHRHSLGFRSFWDQHTAYGNGAFRFNRSHALRRAPGSTLDPGFYMGSLLRFPRALSGMENRRAWSMVPLMILWHIANTVGFVSEGFQFVRKKKTSEG